MTDKSNPLRSLSESTGETSDVVGQLALIAKELDVSTVDKDATSSLRIEVLLTTERSEAPVLGDDDLLAAGELVHGSAESLESDSTV
jgi:hypothetical protein